jgi:GNAT superfamily N-acetyltransferase
MTSATFMVISSCVWRAITLADRVVGDEGGSAPRHGSERPFLRLGVLPTMEAKERPDHVNLMSAQTPATTPRRVEIDGGRWVSIRPIERSDAAGLSELYASLSPESRRRRFLRPIVSVSPAVLAAFTERDGEGMVGILSERGPNDGAVVGHASVQPDGRGGAEVAFTVADELQGRGVGRALVDAAVDLARARGIERVTATLLVDNVPMRRLLGGSGWEIVHDHLDAGVEEITLRVGGAETFGAAP